MMMLRWSTKIFCTGQFAGQVSRFMDQYWQALRTDVDFRALILDD